MVGLWLQSRGLFGYPRPPMLLVAGGAANEGVGGCFGEQMSYKHSADPPLLSFPHEPALAGRRIDLGTVEVLRRWLGRAEVDGNNRVPWLHRLTGAWCASLQWHAMATAATELGFLVPIPYSRRVNLARGLLKLYASAGRSVQLERVRPGDYLCLKRGLSWQGHAQRISAGSWPHIRVIDGNVGLFRRTRGRVREIDVDLRKVRAVGAARLG